MPICGKCKAELTDKNWAARHQANKNTTGKNASSSNVPFRKTSTEIETERKTVQMMFKIDTFSPYVLCKEGECPYLNGIVCLNPDAYVNGNRKVRFFWKGECPWKQK